MVAKKGIVGVGFGVFLQVCNEQLTIRLSRPFCLGGGRNHPDPICLSRIGEHENYYKKMGNGHSSKKMRKMFGDLQRIVYICSRKKTIL
jgi:hypothetical protein